MRLQVPNKSLHKGTLAPWHLAAWYLTLVLHINDWTRKLSSVNCASKGGWAYTRRKKYDNLRSLEQDQLNACFFLVITQGSVLHRVWCLVSCWAAAAMKCGIILSSIIYFVSEVCWDDGGCLWVEEMHTRYAAPPFLCPHSGLVFEMVHERGVPGGPLPLM